MEITSNVSSHALGVLQSDLRSLSAALHDLYDEMNADMSRVNDFWQDQKYQDFVNGYRPQIDKCEEISQRYNRWCSTVLQEAMDKSATIEMADVMSSGGGGSAGPVGAIVDSVRGGTAGGADVAASDTKNAGYGFNLGNADQNNVIDTERQVSDAAADMCARDPNAKGNIKVENMYESDNSKLGGKVNAEFGKKFFKAGGEINGEYDSGKVTSKVSVEKVVDCSKL